MSKQKPNLAADSQKSDFSRHYDWLPVPVIAKNWAGELKQDPGTFGGLLKKNIFGETSTTLGQKSVKGLGFLFPGDDPAVCHGKKNELGRWQEAARHAFFFTAN